MEDTIKMKKHVNVVGIIHIAFGILGIFGAMLTYFLLNIGKGIIETQDVPSFVQDILTVLTITLPLLISVMSILAIVGGSGLLAMKSWARYMIIVVSALGLLNIPIGTLKGVYSLWVLMQDETIKLFQER